MAVGTLENRRWAYDFFLQGAQVVNAVHDGQIGIQMRMDRVDISCWLLGLR